MEFKQLAFYGLLAANSLFIALTFFLSLDVSSNSDVAPGGEAQSGIIGSLLIGVYQLLLLRPFKNEQWTEVRMLNPLGLVGFAHILYQMGRSGFVIHNFNHTGDWSALFTFALLGSGTTGLLVLLAMWSSRLVEDRHERIEDGGYGPPPSSQHFGAPPPAQPYAVGAPPTSGPVAGAPEPSNPDSYQRIP